MRRLPQSSAVKALARFLPRAPKFGEGDLMDAETLTVSKLLAMTKLVPVMQPNAGHIIESEHMVEGPFEDWSRVRSPSRAKRRRSKHRQNIGVYYKPRTDFLCLPDGSMVGHPVTVRHLMRSIGEGMQRKADRMLENAIYGRPLTC